VNVAAVRPAAAAAAAAAATYVLVKNTLADHFSNVSAHGTNAI